MSCLFFVFCRKEKEKKLSCEIKSSKTCFTIYIYFFWLEPWGVLVPLSKADPIAKLGVIARTINFTESCRSVSSPAPAHTYLYLTDQLVKKLNLVLSKKFLIVIAHHFSVLSYKHFSVIFISICFYKEINILD